MECNKDEAMRARQIAEKKMENNDYEGARNIALKAQNLYPELENISQLVSICDVHCSARKLILGNDKDWYGILQVAELADEPTVKKQYRKLALSLHPDKNRFPGAEAAFKLICEANAVLSDPTKKSLYDRKITVKVRTTPVNHPRHSMNRSSQFDKQYVAQNNVHDGFSSFNQQQAPQPSFSVKPEMFFTSCPFCSLKYQCHRKYVNTNLHCQKCSKNFMGFEVTAQAVPVGSKWPPPSAQPAPSKPSVSQSAVSQEKVVLKQGKFSKGVQNDKGPSAAHTGSQRKASSKTDPEPGVQTESMSKGVHVESGANVTVDLKAKETDNSNVNSWNGGNEARTCNGDANNRETSELKNKCWKRGRKIVMESSESSDTSSESDFEEVTTDLNSGSDRVYFPRRSSRKRQNVSYNEDGDDDPLADLKRSQGSKSSGNNENEQKDGLDGEGSKHENQNGFHTETGTAHPKKSDGMPKSGPDTIEMESDSDSDICICDEPEFNDFGKDRDESCFAVNQLWACYDPSDGMPRFYAKVRKVRPEPFELSITWLEADPTNKAEENWMEEDLPVSCGRFKVGAPDKTSRHLSFSHQVPCDKGKKRGSLIIQPRKGEVWALFKDWDLNWTSNPENHRKYKYEVVEVLSDYAPDTGMKVCTLDKIDKFVSLFQRSSHNEADSFFIGPHNLYNFSHQIPSFKMTGSEREGIPVGSFELDPAALPLNPDDLYYPGKAKMKADSVVNCATQKSTIGKGDCLKSDSGTPTKVVDGEVSKLRKSPRGSNSIRRNAS